MTFFNLDDHSFLPLEFGVVVKENNDHQAVNRLLACFTFI